MDGDEELVASLAAVVAEADRLRAVAGSSLREAVGKAADQGLSQARISSLTPIL